MIETKAIIKLNVEDILITTKGVLIKSKSIPIGTEAMLIETKDIPTKTKDILTETNNNPQTPHIQFNRLIRVLWTRVPSTYRAGTFIEGQILAYNNNNREDTLILYGD